MNLIALYACYMLASGSFNQCCSVNLRCNTCRVRLHVGCGLVLDSGDLKNLAFWLFDRRWVWRCIPTGWASVACWGNLHRWLAGVACWGSLHGWWASAALGVGAAKNLRKHARAALACLTGFCGHAPFCNFFSTHPLTRRLAMLAGSLLNTGYRIPQTRGA